MRGSMHAIAAGALALALLPGCAHRATGDDALATLFAAERAFAAHSVEHGMRAAFAAHFADDGMVFWPEPVRLHDALAGAPAANPKAFTLDWRPVAGGVARAGDLGFTTGPWTRTDNVATSPPRHGVFFSVWRRDAGRWRVVADAGAASSEAVPEARLAPAPAIGPAGPVDPSAIERAETAIPDAAAYAAAFADDAMLASDATGVVRGRGALAQLWSGSPQPVRLVPMHAAVAASGDLGYGYGTFTIGAARGSYLHLWTRDAAGAWRIAVATHQAFR